jgi:hypothetical protein
LYYSINHCGTSCAAACAGVEIWALGVVLWVECRGVRVRDKTQGDNFSHIRYFAQNIDWIKRKVAGPFIFIVLKRKTANLELGLSHLKKNPWRKSS